MTICAKSVAILWGRVANYPALNQRTRNMNVDNGNSEVSMSIFPFIQPFRLYDKQSFSFCLMHSVLLKGTICKCIGRSSYITSCYARDVDYFLGSCSEKFG